MGEDLLVMDRRAEEEEEERQKDQKKKTPSYVHIYSAPPR